MEPVLVTRSLRIAVAPERVWASLADGDGLSGWLADAVAIDVVPGASGTAIDGGVVRRIVITDVDAGRSLGFTWWDEQAPEVASTVVITVDAVDGGSVVTVTERLVGATSTGANLGLAGVEDLAAVGQGWDRRLAALLGLDDLADRVARV